METSRHIEHLARQGECMARAAAAAGLTAKVPTCPGWRVADLLRHTGQVHRWATAFVAEELTSYRPWPSPPDGDTDLVSWFRDGHLALVSALGAAPSDLKCWTFLPAPSPLAFWARRQAHETTIHRMDAESARGTRAEDIETELGVDGVDELLAGFHQRSVSKLRSDAPRVLRVRATDTGDVWTVRLSSEAPVTERGATRPRWTARWRDRPRSCMRHCGTAAASRASAGTPHWPSCGGSAPASGEQRVPGTHRARDGLPVPALAQGRRLWPGSPGSGTPTSPAQELWRPGPVAPA